MHWHIYDYFNHSADTQYWRSQTGIIPPEAARNTLQFMRSHVGSIKCNSWSAKDYIGGVHVSAGNVAIYRVYNGGRDEAGRPQRWVALMLCGTLQELGGVNIIELLEQPPFASYANSSLPDQAPFPTDFPIHLVQKPRPGEPAVGSFAEAGAAAVQKASAASRQLTTPRQEGQIVFENIGSEPRVWCRASETSKIANEDRTPIFKSPLSAAEPTLNPNATPTPRPEKSWMSSIPGSSGCWLMIITPLTGLLAVLAIWWSISERKEEIKAPQQKSSPPQEPHLVAAPPYPRSSGEDRREPSKQTIQPATDVERLTPDQMQVVTDLRPQIGELLQQQGLDYGRYTIEGGRFLKIEILPPKDDSTEAQEQQRKKETEQKRSAPMKTRRWFWPF